MSAIFLTQHTGFLAPIAKLLGYILNVLAEFLNMFGIMNAGLTIILFTFIVNAFMIPLTIKQQKYSKLSSRMAPELTKIQKKYKNKKDPDSMRKQQMETQAVYQKYGTSPTGGCLPMLITIPILFALYRVVYHIPAYVNLYYDLYSGTAKDIMNTDGFVDILKGWKDLKLSQPLQVPIADWSAQIANHADVVRNNMVELLSQLNAADWKHLQTLFPDVTSIQQTMHDAHSVNSIIGGLNVTEAPGFGFPGIIIPLLAAGFQWIQTKLMTSANATNMDDNPMGSTMKIMNNVMPVTSGVFCAFFPLGMGLYWVAGSLFRAVQQFFVNKYLDKMDLDALIKKNVDKSNKKRERRGLDPVKIEEISKQRTSAIKDKKNVQTSSNKGNSKSNKKNQQPSDYKRSEVSYKAGSIAANARLLSKKNGEKGER